MTSGSESDRQAAHVKLDSDKLERKNVHVHVHFNFKQPTEPDAGSAVGQPSVSVTCDNKISYG
jgi:hypothetical protein